MPKARFKFTRAFLQWRDVRGGLTCSSSRYSKNTVFIFSFFLWYDLPKLSFHTIKLLVKACSNIPRCATSALFVSTGNVNDHAYPAPNLNNIRDLAALVQGHVHVSAALVLFLLFLQRCDVCENRPYLFGVQKENPHGPAAEVVKTDSSCRFFTNHSKQMQLKKTHTHTQ